MTPKEKAKELMLKYYDLIEMSTVSFSKQCALIAVDGLIKESKLHDKTIYQHGRTFYWEEVKQEIEKL